MSHFVTNILKRARERERSMEDAPFCVCTDKRSAGKAGGKRAARQKGKSFNEREKEKKPASEREREKFVGRYFSEFT